MASLLGRDVGRRRLLPFLTFCSLRLAVVGHFGLVSFGGWNVAGIAVEMLDRPLINAHVPEDLRATALDILDTRDRARRRHGLTGAFREGRIFVDDLNENYNVNVWEVTSPVFYGRYPDANTAEGKLCCTAINQDLTRLSLSVIRARKSAYMASVSGTILWDSARFEMPIGRWSTPRLLPYCSTSHGFWFGPADFARPCQTIAHGAASCK